MLIHVTATHSEDNCPGYNTELIPEVMKGLEAREEIARRRNIKLLGLWSAAPDHTFYALLEANSLFDIDLFFEDVTPFKQGFKVTPVITADELVKLGKELMAQARA
ncbi:MAG: hypothetical protein HYS09_10655 [Chloroflexi bacterium]|nr:hypothetical protein [Chloroflexota bacterium]